MLHHCAELSSHADLGWGAHRLNDTHLSVAANGADTKFFIHFEFFRRVEPLQCEWTVRSLPPPAPQRPAFQRCQASHTQGAGHYNYRRQSL
jgi:hypothetical protein